MDVTIRNVEDAVFRNFKAKCAEMDISMGEGFDFAIAHWLNLENKKLSERKADFQNAAKSNAREKIAATPKNASNKSEVSDNDQSSSQFQAKSNEHKITDLSIHLKKLHAANAKTFNTRKT